MSTVQSVGKLVSFTLAGDQRKTCCDTTAGRSGTSQLSNTGSLMTVTRIVYPTDVFWTSARDYSQLRIYFSS